MSIPQLAPSAITSRIARHAVRRRPSITSASDVATPFAADVHLAAITKAGAGATKSFRCDIMDEVDRAQEAEEAERERALKAVRDRIAASFVPRDPRVGNDCIDCGSPIEQDRLKVLHRTARCAACAHMFERLHRGAVSP
jgi:RNA polymerase-binding transcription factor DksA